MIGDNLRNAALAEIVVATAAIKNGFNVYFPFSGASKSDLILERNGQLKRIQTKKIWRNQRGNRVCQAVAQSYNRRTRQSYLPYNEQQIDLIIAVETETNDCWIVPLADVKQIKSNISLDNRSSYKNNWDSVC